MVSDQIQEDLLKALYKGVSIRFEVRGGFRRECGIPTSGAITFQSALRFAVVSDGWASAGHRAARPAVSIRFEVRGGFRRENRVTVNTSIRIVSIRFEVRGGFRRHRD